MMRSMFSGISGLKGFQQAMDVIGNNIANVNTVGFKGGRTTFQSMMQQTIVGAKAPEEGGRGGANALQIGLGTMMSSVDILMNQGSFQNTGKKTDLGIQGDGFFVLSDGIQNFYSRAGNFMMDETGHFVQPSTGLKLQGWLAKIDPRTGTRFLDRDKPPSDIFISAGMTMPAKATSNMFLGGNLNSEVGIEPLTITVRNPLDPSKTYQVRFTFEKVPPFDTERLFSGGTIKYTWKAEIVDWNAVSPSELPELRNMIGVVELNQFGQVEKFLRYSTDSLSGAAGAGFDNTIISGDLEKTWFNYSPSGGTLIEEEVKSIFDANDDGILDKIITKITYTPDEGTVPADEYFIDPTTPLGNEAQTAIVNFGTLGPPAAGDIVNVTYYRQDRLAYDATRNNYRIAGPILDSAGASDITEVDIIVRTDIPPAGISLTPGIDYTYDSSTGTINIINHAIIPGGTTNLYLEYATKAAFTGNSTDTSWRLERAIQNPFAPGGNSTNGFDTKIDLDLQFNVDESMQRVNLRAAYPRAGTDPEKYTVYYADPSNPTDFDSVDILVGTDLKGQISIPKTGQIKFFDRNDTQNFVTGIYEAPRYSTATTIYDSLGKPYTIFMEFYRINTNQWAWRAVEESGIPVEYVDDRERTYTPNSADMSSIVGGVIEFDSGGRISAFKAMRQNGLVEDDIRIMRIKFNPSSFVDDGAAPPPEEGAAPVIAMIDFSELVQFANPSTATVREQDGNSMGVLQAFAINNAGQLVGTFTNGKSDMLAQLAMAIFNNPAGLMDIGNTLYTESANSGIAQIGVAGVGGRGMLSPGVLEMSNVDLAEEFTGMVIVQRAFQANARTITTVDQILQELVNLKRG